ncbi:MAG: AAA family ATPase [Candidatus Omnitrophica bacterium]|nr:AAA family ATPase [Candidatus Omnitrophota bacterium]
MYFKRLEIVGFKSFMDKTVLNFEPGVTAVVGPNGCGKSNIFDSIRWVLGEQSAKSLRGSAMEDVIFNGTDTKPALGMAEVSLTFDNEQRHFNVDQDEVVITRRIFRSGESEYLLNKNLGRLKDIQDLLLGTGIGAESYSIIAQGKIDLILSSRPEDRRMVFDEASGITRYKSQKREALRRLEETEQNLLRLNDIIVEVKRSIGYLERQANKARRFQVCFDELKAKEIKLALAQKKNLIQEISGITIYLDSLRNREEALLAQIKADENNIGQRNMELKGLEADLANMKNAIMNSENLIERNRQHTSFNHERIKELGNTKTYLESQILQTRERVVKDEEKLKGLKEEQEAIRKSFEEKSLILKTHEDKLNDLVGGIKRSHDIIAQDKKNIMDLANMTTQVKNELTDFASREQVFIARQKRLDLEKAKIAEERSQVEGNLTELDKELMAGESLHQELCARIAAAKAELDAETLKLKQAEEELETLERQKTGLISQKEFLEKLKSQYEDISESMNATIYLDKLPAETITGLVVKLKAVQGGPDPVNNDLSAQGYKMSGEAKPIDLDAQRVNDKIKEIEEKILGLAGTKLLLETRIKELTASNQALDQQEQDQEMALANKKTVHHTILEQFNKIKEEEELIALELSDVLAELKSLEEKILGLKARLAGLENKDRELEASIHAEQESISHNSRIKEEVLVEMTQVKTVLENLGQRLNSEDETLKALEDACRQGNEDIHNQENKIKETVSRQQGLEEEIKNLDSENLALVKEIDAQRNTLSEADKKYAAMSESVNGIISRIDAKRNDHEILKENIYSEQMRQKDIEFKYQTIKDRMNSAYKIDLDRPETISAADSALQVVPVEQAPVSAAAPEDNSRDQADVVFPVVTDPVLLLTGPSAPQEPVEEEVIDEGLLSEEIEKLKERIDSYGTVNLVAIAEYDELKKRYDFLNQQQADLAGAKESLQEAIRKINHTTKKMFMETFEKVREEFRNYFKMLFNGGDAQVYLIDENDPLESGIELVCRPPGKKLQNVLLLSGGEKSLSAIALIFAIFKVKPAPFCILDEIDAALDESNVDRFSRMFSEFTGTSQFIVITHNKRTIANANVMYGITMQESGVSKIVSVKFAESKTKSEPAPQPVAA